MLDALISSQTRIKLLLKFFLNSDTTAYLRGLETEFGDSSNGIRLELNRLEDAGMLVSQTEGNKKVFKANTRHPLFSEIHSLVRKHLGLDQIVDQVARRLGDLDSVFLAGAFAKGMDSQIVDLVFVGDVDKRYLFELVEKAEGLIKRKIRYLIYTPEEFIRLPRLSNEPQPLLLWAKESYEVTKLRSGEESSEVTK